MGSFEKINYKLRPNKNIERKLIIQLLEGLRPSFAVSQYRYIGMGSMWYVDHRLIHRRLDIQDMVSIERESVARAHFNCPFQCIRVEEGDTTPVLRDLDLEEKPVIVWLDHDSELNGPAIDDCQIVVESVPCGSVVMVTVNAHPGQLRGHHDEDNNELAKEEVLMSNWEEYLRLPLSSDAANHVGFSDTVAEILINAARHQMVEAGRENEEFVPLMAFSYRDTSPMVTVGGMICNGETRERLRRCSPWDKLDYVLPIGDELSVYEIDVPPLTSKEKAELDQHLPRDEEFTEEYIEEKLPFALDEGRLEAYRRFYKEYPIFGELLM